MNQKIDTLSFVHCTNSEIHVGTTRILNDCTLHMAQDAYVTGKVAEIQVKVEELETALKNIGRNPKTAVVKTMQIQRRKRLVALIGLLSGLASDEDQPEQVAKALKLLAIINQQGRGTGRGSYFKTTSAIRIMLDGFDTPENAVIVDELGLRRLVERLRTAQSEFENAFEERVTLEGATPRIGAVRKAINYEVVGLLSYIDHEAVRNPQGLETLVNKLNEQIRGIMANVRARTTRSKNKGTPPVPEKELPVKTT
jgi:hypothetical protein